MLRSLAVVAMLGAACGSRPACGPRDDHQVVACVDGDAITATELRAYLRPAEPGAGRVAPDPRRDAIDRAVRVRLFAAEAARRGLAVPDSASPAIRQAGANRALIVAEDAARGLGAERVSDDDAERYYAAHPGMVSEVSSVRARAVFARDQAAAEAAAAKAMKLDDDGFAALARAASIDASAADGGDLGVIDHARPKELVRLASALREPGALAGPVRFADGRWVLLRAIDVQVAIEPWSPALAARVKNLLAHQREAEALDALEAALRRDHDVRVFDDELARVPAP